MRWCRDLSNRKIAAIPSGSFNGLYLECGQSDWLADCTALYVYNRASYPSDINNGLLGEYDAARGSTTVGRGARMRLALALPATMD